MNRSSRFKWSVVLIPFSWLYGLVIWIRNTLYDNNLIKATGFSIPTISVGNITVGGTGKTPHVEYLVDLIKNQYPVAILSRGYKRRTRDFQIVSEKSASWEVGDEPLQLKNRFPDVTVAVDRKRVNGVRELMKPIPRMEVIVLDDAYQHRSIRAGYSILLIDYSRPILSDRLLPAGMLREPAINRHRAQMILVTRSPRDLKPIEMREFVNRMSLGIGQHLFFTTMHYEDLIPVFAGVEPKGLESVKNHAGGILIVSGIANPGTLYEFAKEISEQVEEIRLGDHHRYTAKDVKRIQAKLEEMGGSRSKVLILTTEKDAVKLREMEMPESIRNALYAVRIRVQFLNNDQEKFEKQIISYVASNKRSSILYKEED